MFDDFIKDLKSKQKIIINIKVKTNSVQTKIREIMSDGIIKIDLKSLPIENKANEELIKFLSKQFKISKDSVEIISGKTSKNKIIKISI